MTTPEPPVPFFALGRAGHDPRAGEEYWAALERETEASLRRDPSRWKWRRTNELPTNRSTEPEAAP
jgi:hypothetical protein